MSIEAMKQALDALEDACGNRCNAEYNPCFQRDAITSLRQAIEQAEKQSDSVELVDKEYIKELKDQSYCLLAILEHAGEGATVGDVLAILDTHPQPNAKQEPVARVCHDLEQHIGWHPDAKVNELPEGMPLYTSPQPQKPWVGLNWDDLPEIYVGDTAFLHGAKWAEAKFKEKNT